MGGFVDFLVNNYLIFLLIALVLVFALVGYLVDSKKKDGVVEPKEEKKDVALEVKEAKVEPVKEDIAPVTKVKKEKVVEPVAIEETIDTSDALGEPLTDGYDEPVIVDDTKKDNFEVVDK